MSSFNVSAKSGDSAADLLYFAYGSNMYLPQMAVRCRDSTLFARGVLRNYKWQTNSLGGGNIVESTPEDLVEGILFTVSPSDVQTLRHYEGTEWKYFVEKEVQVEVEPVSDTVLQAPSQKSADVAEFLTHHNSEFNLKLTGPRSVTNAASNGAAGDPNRATIPSGGKVLRKALAYISYKYQLPGDIRDEYVVRMHLAMAYARLLGVSKAYLETSLYPQIFGKRLAARYEE